MMGSSFQEINVKPKKKHRGRKPTDLQKTQVLNLREVEEVARYERRTSKKPAIVIGVIGLLLIAFGSVFPLVMKSLKEQKTFVEERKTSLSKKNEIALKCVMSSYKNDDGTDTVYTIHYYFEDGKLSRFTKIFHVTETSGNPKGADTVAKYLNSYQSFLNPTDGYQISVVPINKGLVTTVDVDYEKLDLLELSPKQQEHFTTKVDFAMDTSIITIKDYMIRHSFICQ